MTALFCLGYDGLSYNVAPTLAVVADETHFGYVHRAPDSDTAKELEARATHLSEGKSQHSPAEWLELGTSNMNYVLFTGPIRKPSFDEAMAAAQDLLTEDTTGEQDT